jgi:hypothetical protein
MVECGVMVGHRGQPARVLAAQPSSSPNVPLHCASRYYVTQPVRKPFACAIIRSKEQSPRLRRVISRTRSLARARLLRPMPSVPPLPRRWPRNWRSPIGAEPAPAKAGGALLPVDLEFEPVFQERRHRRHHPLARRHRPHVDIAIVGVSAEPVSPSFQLLVEIVQQKVGEQRRQRAAIRLYPLVGSVQVRRARHLLHQLPRQGSLPRPCRRRLWLLVRRRSFRLRCRRRGAALPSGRDRAGPLGPHRLAAASRPSVGSDCSLHVGFSPSSGHPDYYGLG